MRSINLLVLLHLCEVTGTALMAAVFVEILAFTPGP